MGAPGIVGGSSVCGGAGALMMVVLRHGMGAVKRGLFAALADGSVIPFSNTTSILNSNSSNLELFPNPAKEQLILNNLPFGGNVIQIIDVTGKVVLSKETNNNIEQISLETINKHISDLSVSISGELAFNNEILFRRQYFRTDLEMF